MIIKNRFGVPEEIVEAARNDKYSKGLADISITTLIDAPQINQLRGKHLHELETDISDRIWALLGTAVHKLLEEAGGPHIAEERLYGKAAGLTISGGIDRQEVLEDGSILLRDYKVCQVSAVSMGKEEWVRQLNGYAWMIRQSKGQKVSRIQVCAFLRDWRRSESLQDSRYPASPITMLDIPLWSEANQDAYILGRAMLHAQAMQGEDIPCSEEEQWAREEKFAAYKSPDAKRASKLFSGEKEALAYAEEKGYTVKRRPGLQTRCVGDYCQVSRYCQQYRDSKGEE